MSTDNTRLALGQVARSLPAHSQHAPLYAVLASPEGAGPATFGGPGSPDRTAIGYLEQFYQSPSPRVVTEKFSSEPGGWYGVAVFAAAGCSEEQWNAAYSSLQQLSERMIRITRGLPAGVLARLGFDPRQPPSDWVRTLFHLAWHFPNYFEDSAARHRAVCGRGLFGGVGSCQEVPEFDIQTRGIPAVDDPYPGYVFARLVGGLHLVAATERAVDLYTATVAESRPRPADFAERARELHVRFSVLSQTAAVMPGGRDVIDTPVIRVGSVFDTAPVLERAERGPEKVLVLSARDAVRECCLVRGGFSDQLVALADRAGALLPVWPEVEYPVVLDDVDMWRRAQTRAAEVGAEEWVGTAEDGTQVPLPAADVAEHVRTSLWRPSRHSMVTDGRGNVERWIGFVFDTYRRHEPNSLEVTTHPENHPPGMPGWTAVMRLRGLDIFAASARAIELAGWLPAPTPQPAVTPTAAVETSSGPSVPPGKRKGKNVEARMLKVIAEKPESLTWSASQWAQHLGCSAGTVKGTETWKERIASVRAAAKVDAAMRRKKAT